MTTVQQFEQDANTIYTIIAETAAQSGDLLEVSYWKDSDLYEDPIVKVESFVKSGQEFLMKGKVVPAALQIISKGKVKSILLQDSGLLTMLSVQIILNKVVSKMKPDAAAMVGAVSTTSQGVTKQIFVSGVYDGSEIRFSTQLFLKGEKGFRFDGEKYEFKNTSEFILASTVNTEKLFSEESKSESQSSISLTAVSVNNIGNKSDRLSEATSLSYPEPVKNDLSRASGPQCSSVVADFRPEDFPGSWEGYEKPRRGRTGRAWAPNHPEITETDRKGFLGEYLGGKSFDSIADYYNCSHTTVKTYVAQDIKLVRSPLELLYYLRESKYRFACSGVLNIDTTYPQFNPLGGDDVKPTLTEITDGTYPGCPYHVIFQGKESLTWQNFKDFVKEFVQFQDNPETNPVNLIIMDYDHLWKDHLSEVAALFGPLVKIQLSLFQSKKYISQELGRDCRNTSQKIVREVALEACGKILDLVKDGRSEGQEVHSIADIRNAFSEGLKILERITSDYSYDKQLLKVFKHISGVQDFLLSSRELGIGIASTAQVESFHSVYDDRIRKMRGFKNLEAMECFLNAYGSYSLFKLNKRGAKYEGRRAIDLCHNPRLTGIWSDYLFRMPIG